MVIVHGILPLILGNCHCYYILCFEEVFVHAHKVSPSRFRVNV